MWKSLTITLFTLSSLAGTAQPPIVFDKQPHWKNGVDISRHIVMFDEVGAEPLSFESAKNQKFISFSFSNARYADRSRIVRWLRFDVDNSGKDTLQLLLNLNPHFRVQLYDSVTMIEENGIAVHRGKEDRLTLPLIVNPTATRRFWVRMEEQVRYLTPLIPILNTKESFALSSMREFHQERWLRFFIPVMAGILCLIMIFGFYQYFLLRETAYLFYGMFAGFALMFAIYCSEERLNLGWFGQKTTFIINSIIPAGILLSYTHFISRILDIHKRHPKSWLLLKLLMFICVLQSVLSLYESLSNKFLFASNFYYSYLTGTPQLVTAAIIFYCASKSTNPVRKFIIAGLSCLFLFYFLPICIGFTEFHEMPYELGIIVHYGPFFFVLGLTLEAVCFSFALAYRTKLISLENSLLHKNYTQQLEMELARRTEEVQKQNQLLEEQHMKQLLTEFEQKLAVTEMTALRAQMNPHFIFNCLNSIKLYTLENDSATASEYLTIFSQLIRLVLENSSSEKVSLENELETLRLYMAMEAMRFKSKLQYTIEVDEEIDAAYVEIPPLLLQPYVENAIWHGLMHKSEGGYIHINVKYKSPDLLSVTISDNGVGRKLANEYKSKSVTRQKSFGMKLTSERITLINQLYQSRTSVQIIDRMNSKNEAIGTEVLIDIPV